MNAGELAECYETYKNTIYRMAYACLRNTADAEDIVQETFLKRFRYEKTFASAESEKAWLLRVAVNGCKDLLKCAYRRYNVPLDEAVMQLCVTPEEHAVTEAVLNLPDIYRLPVHLFYFEGYDTGEIGKILGVSQTAVRTRLHRARAMLKSALGEELAL